MQISSAQGQATALICIDSYDRAVPVGSLYIYPLGTKTPFHGLTELLLETDRQLRQEQRGNGFAEDAPDFMQRGELATFMVKLMFFRNRSWQGKLISPDSNTSQSFRSVLELVRLMDEVLKDKTRA